MLCEHSVLFSATWPTSGMTRDGSAFALPTWGPAMAGSVSSSSPGRELPTPAARDGKGLSLPSRQGGLALPDALLPTPEAKLAHSGPDYARADWEGSGGDDLATSLHRLLPTPEADHETELLFPTPRATRGGSGTETMYRLGAERTDEHRTQGEVLLPTPRATDGTNGGPNQRGSAGDLMLPSAVQQLLPTPIEADSRGSRRHGYAGTKAGTTLTDAAQLLPTPNPFHLENTETPEEWLARRAEVQERTGTRHVPALPVVALSIEEGHPLYQGGKGPTLWSSGDPIESPSPDTSDWLAE
jgi:hypothetical protein